MKRFNEKGSGLDADQSGNVRFQSVKIKKDNVTKSNCFIAN